MGGWSVESLFVDLEKLYVATGIRKVIDAKRLCGVDKKADFVGLSVGRLGG